ncbi:MAG: fibronectin type III domain-containing protein, partial [Alphaproteobacteria bacterium]|nr:fibronectin type III domain-containing protein [Alphaproteobacteria bacterium]
MRWKPVTAAVFAPENDAEVEAPKLSYDITGLTNGTTYEVQIAAKTAERTGEYSDPALGAAHHGVCVRIEAVKKAITEELNRLGDSGVGCAEVSEDKLRTLQMLDLTHKGILNLPEESFAGMSGLERLYLTRNLMTSLPANVFAGLTSLTQLALERTAMTTLPADVFADLGALRLLNLTNAALNSLPLGAFNGLFPGVEDPGTGAFDGLLTTGVTLPDPPPNLQLTVRNGELRAQWDEVPGAHYQLRWREAGAEWARENAAATAATVHTIAGLTNGADYEVRVAAVPDALTATNSEIPKQWKAAEAQAAPAQVAPDTPREVQTAAGNKRIEVRWQAPLVNGGADISGYYVRYKALGATTYGMKTTAASELTLTITDADNPLQNGTTYEVGVAAQNRIGKSEFADAPPAVPFTTPDAPAVAVEPDNEELRVTWEAPDDKGRAVSAY